ncbi:cytotoxic translational repressor of toxin-antitoxin stability system [Actinomycetospora termitidis]|uniref:Cytotoxic translational repressor of toxin-antitoxin stability system n=1 Tax=Actinomycetospora termitidis TaxID=3053470 RepID=A0ABT7MHN8_9PSEU|nr:cytotoxic translational repressor of toxin-antitoxin stability system [Actinomycetospora sp. Odt1-22]MDL5160195.1 cytotoxic translational repressor of toxin-antitoxin stability system [Actinomycetospora sp. Odt1-22]
MRGRTGTHHVTYELALPDGRVLRTRVSHPPGRQTYGKALWSHILRDQLDVDEATFWSCVHDGQAPDRGEPPVPDIALPAEVVALLMSRVGLDESDVRAMSKDEAIARLHRFWTEGH